MNNEQIISHCINAINSIIKEFQENPYNFLYENDIQCTLFSELRKRITGHVEVPKRVGGKYVLNLVYSEYLDKIDIACLDPRAPTKLDLSSLNQSEGYDTYIYSLPVLVGIELKYVYMGYKKGFDILTQDFLKLTHKTPPMEMVENCLVLGFVQRDEEAKYLINNAEKHYQLISLNSVDHLNDIYIITPNKIYAPYPELHWGSQGV